MNSSQPNDVAPANHFPSLTRLFAVGALLPALVAISNEAIVEFAPRNYLRYGLYPWLIFCVAILSWCAGRYLAPRWLAWVLFAWECALLDILTITVCFRGGFFDDLPFTLVSAQISLVLLWAVLEASAWQWRLPCAFAVAAVVLGFGGILTHGHGWQMKDWFQLMLLTTTTVLLLCASLRLSGFALRQMENFSAATTVGLAIRPNQFGVKHMMFWAAAAAPLLLVGRGIDLLVFKRLGQPGTFQAILLAILIATTNLTAIWATLGRGAIAVRIAALVTVPLVLATFVNLYVKYMQAAFSTTPRQYVTLMYGLFSIRANWYVWLWLDAALLAALLLFLRASGHRLVRAKD